MLAYAPLPLGLTMISLLYVALRRWVGDQSLTMRDAVLSGRSARAYGVHALGPINGLGLRLSLSLPSEWALCLGEIRLVRRSAAHGRAPVTPQTA